MLREWMAPMEMFFLMQGDMLPLVTLPTTCPSMVSMSAPSRAGGPEAGMSPARSLEGPYIHAAKPRLL